MAAHRGSTQYNALAGTNVERLTALSDGVFAIALTLLVLDLKVPAADAIHSSRDLTQALIGLSPKFLIWGISFLTVGIFWVGQQTQLNHLGRGDRDLCWLHLVFLLAVSLLPFSASLMGEFIEYRLALLIYWGNIVALGGMLYATWCHARVRGLLKDNIDPAVISAVERRILLAQALYAFGAALCVIGTFWSIGFILAVQLNYAIGPRIGILARL
jgi:uncharacterized membrane protein